MARHLKPPKSIDEYGGMDPYLEATAHLHNNLVLKDLLFRLNPKRRHVVPKTVIAEDFNVTPQTIYSWIRRLIQERRIEMQAAANPESSEPRTETGTAEGPTAKQPPVPGQGPV